jgi:hypothetical protein
MPEDEAPPIGHNKPPPLTPLEEARELASSLEMEAASWLDGAPIENEVQAQEVAKLIDAARKAAKKIDEGRKAEKEPHIQASRAVDEVWRPLLDAVGRIAETGKAAQLPWLQKLEAAKREAAEAAARAAAQKEAEARRWAANNNGSLAAVTARDRAIEEAEAAKRQAARAESDTRGTAKGAGMTRAIGLRTVWLCEVEDARALLNHIAKRDPDLVRSWLASWADKEVRNGARSLPGVKIWSEQRAA